MRESAHSRNKLPFPPKSQALMHAGRDEGAEKNCLEIQDPLLSLKASQKRMANPTPTPTPMRTKAGSRNRGSFLLREAPSLQDLERRKISLFGRKRFAIFYCNVLNNKLSRGMGTKIPSFLRHTERPVLGIMCRLLFVLRTLLITFPVLRSPHPPLPRCLILRS